MRTKNVLMNSLETEFEHVWPRRLNFLTFPYDLVSISYHPFSAHLLQNSAVLRVGLLLTLTQLTLCFKIGFIIKW